MPHLITAARLYDYTICPHRVWRDVYGPRDEKIEEVNPFVQLLWERGVVHEEKVVSQLGEFVDMTSGKLSDRAARTIEAMRGGAPLIYQGVLQSGDMLGIPDILKQVPGGRYVPVEIKSGVGFEGANSESGDPGKSKKHYAVQLALYVDLLERLGFENDRIAAVIDIRLDEVEYDLDSPVGKIDTSTLWEYYQQTKGEVSRLLKDEIRNKPALAGICKLCPWYKSCKKWVDESGDLTKIFYLGRSRRDRINADLKIEKIDDIVGIDISEVMRAKSRDKQFLRGVGEKTLAEIVRRADVMVNLRKPVAYGDYKFPKVGHELFFDIEDDPTLEFVYMHGVFIKDPSGEKYLDFTATEFSEEAEERAWLDFWSFIRSLPSNDYAVYYYSHHEKTTYRRMQKIYPDVISEAELDAFFSNPKVIDLYEIVRNHTDWPVSSYSLKDLAQYLGFKWRDESPSGALSIQWFNEFLETGDQTLLQRLLIYNEDDCMATMVLKEGIENVMHTKF